LKNIIIEATTNNPTAVSGSRSRRDRSRALEIWM